MTLDKMESDSPSNERSKFTSIPLDSPISKRNSYFIDQIADICGFKKGKSWSDLKKGLSEEQVREIYRQVQFLWPPDTDVSKIFPQYDGKLRGLFLGFSHPENIEKNILRYSLYTDEILVMSPFLNPWTVKEEFNPVANPGQYKTNTLRLIYMLSQLEPFIRSGIVTLMPNPGDFDHKLKIETIKLAEERFKNRNNLDEYLEDSDFSQFMEENFIRDMLRFSDEVLMNNMKKIMPEKSEDELLKVIKYMRQKQKNDPLALEQPIETSQSELTHIGSGANLEMALYISKMTGSYIFTNAKGRWKEILSIGKIKDTESEIWSPLTKAFQNLDFKFLDSVPLKFASDIREEGRLDSFRRYLRDLWKQTTEKPDDVSSEKTVNQFCKSLKEEYRLVEEDWEKIDGDLLREFTKGAIAAGGTALGTLNWQIPASGFAIKSIIDLLSSRLDKKRFRERTPLSVLVDLSGTKKK